MLCDCSQADSSIVAVVRSSRGSRLRYLNLSNPTDQNSDGKSTIYYGCFSCQRPPAMCVPPNAKRKKQIALEGPLQPPTLWLAATRSLTN
jgi:hypothetical protein